MLHSHRLESSISWNSVLFGLLSSSSNAPAKCLRFNCSDWRRTTRSILSCISSFQPICKHYQSFSITEWKLKSFKRIDFMNEESIRLMHLCWAIKWINHLQKLYFCWKRENMYWSLYLDSPCKSLLFISLRRNFDF